MKKINFLLLPIILLFGIFTAKAQDETYHPLVQEGKIWNVLDAEETHDPTIPISTYNYQTFSMLFSGDTTINDVLYKKMYVSTKEFPKFPQDYTLQNFMREDEDKRVWLIKENGFGEQWEELIYDFSLQIGDTVPKELYDGGLNCFLIVEDISDEIMHNGEVRKIFRFSWKGLSIMEDYWIEGIGSNYGLLISFGSGIAGGFYELLCFHENDELIFFNEKYQTCYKSSVGVNTYNNQVNIYPNPAKDRLYLEMNESMNIHAISLINIQGQTVRSYEPTATQLNISGIAEGIYFMKLSSSEGDVVKKIVKI